MIGRARQFAGVLVLVSGALSVLLIFSCCDTKGERTLSHRQMATLFGAEDLCGCDLEPHEDCNKPDEKCPCADSYEDPTCEGVKKDFLNRVRNTCKSGNKTKRCIKYTITCWIEKYCQRDGEVQPNKECTIPGEDTACSDSELPFKCMTCKLGDPTGAELPLGDEECVSN